ncbi:MAG: energy transducer TonB [Chthoniobacterales bacterium]|nr:energy transducer TonB [Chthoniobacterales bacterium]
MEKFSVRQLANLFLTLALVGGALSGCQKKSETAAPATPTPSVAAGTSLPQPAPAITGPVTPALVQEGPNSITHYLHFPKDAAASKLDGAVQFYCDITEEGMVETTHALVANNDVFKGAVMEALDWGRFTPATVNGKPVRVYLGGTVLFIHQGGKPVIVVSLATHARDRVGKLANYIQPQLVGGLRRALQAEISTLTQGIVVSGQAEAVVSVDAKGAVTGTSGLSENPKGSGLGILLDSAVRKTQFLPAYENGTPTAGGINVVGNFARF